MLPTGASFLGIVAGGVVSDYLLKRGCSVRTARARFPGLTVGLSLPFLLTAVTTPSATFSVILFICFYFTLSLAVSGYWSMPLERVVPVSVRDNGGRMRIPSCRSALSHRKDDSHDTHTPCPSRSAPA
jgi:hypothetical protein